MNNRTGEIRDFPDGVIPIGWTQIKGKAKDGCKHCYGRGWTGTNDRGMKVICNCVKMTESPPKVGGESDESD